MITHQYRLRLMVEKSNTYSGGAKNPWIRIVTQLKEVGPGKDRRPGTNAGGDRHPVAIRGSEDKKTAYNIKIYLIWSNPFQVGPVIAQDSPSKRGGEGDSTTRQSPFSTLLEPSGIGHKLGMHTERVRPPDVSVLAGKRCRGGKDANPTCLLIHCVFLICVPFEHDRWPQFVVYNVIELIVFVERNENYRGCLPKLGSTDQAHCGIVS